MQPSHLRVRARGQGLVQKIEALNASPREFVGREWCEVDGKSALRSVEGDVEVDNRAEYRACVKEGSLWAADEATAAACGVKFDPLFGVAAAEPTPTKRNTRGDDAKKGADQ